MNKYYKKIIKQYKINNKKNLRINKNNRLSRM